MWNDVVDLREFYDSRTGQMARHMIRRAVRAMWPDVHARVVLGLGYATPYLRQFRDEAERVIAFMPAAQGVLHWPPEGPFAVSLVDETELPLPDYSVDRVLLVHGLESGEYVRDMLKEVWRVMTGDARLLVVVPNRQSLWAQLERSPFGHGQPYSHAQITRLLREQRFTPMRRQHALFLPPTRSRTLLRSAAAWERIGTRWFPGLGGVLLVEAGKQVYAAIPERAVARRRRALIGPLPKVAGPAHGRLQGAARDRATQ